MFEHILECPQCEQRFHYEHSSEGFPASLVCPRCGAESMFEDYMALVLCRECHVKLKIPMSIMGEEGNVCPQCGAEIQYDFLDPLADSAMTLSEAVTSSGRKRLLQDGEFFDKFKIISLLGKGGMAEVYLAEHLLLKQICALKLMQRTLDQDDNPVFIKRFVREAKLTHSLNHPNIVKVFDAGSDFKTGYLFLAMEYVEGETLHDIITENEISEAGLLEIASSMAAALKVLEEARVVHRDIKPSNIMYTNDGIYKLMDLGIAKIESNHQAGDMTLTMEQSSIGTPGYASPEQCRAAHQTDIRSDIFSLGATLYHAASGVLPFSGDTPMAVILNVMQKDPEPLKNHRTDLSDRFIALIEKMMRKDPAERFQNVDELITAIEQLEVPEGDPSPVKRLTKAVSALTTGFFARQEKKSGSVISRFAALTFKLFLALFIIAAAAVHLYYFFSQLKVDNGPDKLSYSEFMKLLFTDKKIKKKFAPQDVRSHLKLLEPMGSDSAPALVPVEVTKDGKTVKEYPMVTFPVNRFVSFNFNDGSKLKGLQALCRKGSLVLTGQKRDGVNVTAPPNTYFPRPQHCKQQGIFFNFQIPFNDATALVSFGDLELFVLDETLRVVLGDKLYADTGINIPADYWMNLGAIVDHTQNRVFIISENRLICTLIWQNHYSFKGSSIVSFASPHLKKQTIGKIDFLAFAYGDCPVTLVQPVVRKPFRTYENKLPERISFYSKTETSPQKTPAVSPAPRKAPAPKPAPEVKKAPAPVPPKAPEVKKTPAPKPQPAPRRSGAILPVFGKSLQPFAARDLNVDRWLTELRKRQRAYDVEVEVLQESLKNIPASVPSEVRQKRQLIASTAAEINQMWKDRLVFLKNRNRKILAAKRKAANLSDHFLNNRIQREIQKYITPRGEKRPIQSDTLSRQLLSWISYSAADPNLFIAKTPHSSFSGSLLQFVMSGLPPRSEALLEALLKRYADPSTLKTVVHNENTAELLTRYGHQGDALDITWNHYIKMQPMPINAMELLAILFTDGAIPRQHHLTHAVKTGNYDLVLFLLAAGADPNLRNQQGEPPYFATYNLSDGQKFRELLLAGGADPELVSTQGKRAADYTYLADFARSWDNRNMEGIKSALLSKKISPDAVLKDGKTLLVSACESANEDLVRMLLALGASPIAKGDDGTYPLYAACRLGAADITFGEAERRRKIILLLLEKNYGNPPHLSEGTTILNVILRYPDINSLIPDMQRYVGKLNDTQWNELLLILINKHEQGRISADAVKMLLERIPGKILAKNHQFVKLPLSPQILQNAFNAGLNPNAMFPIRYYRKYDNYPLLGHLIRQKQTPAVIETALRAGANPHWRRNSWDSYDTMTQQREILNLLRQYRIKRF